MISSSTEAEDEGDDVPFADPAIRIAFEAALGGFILAFNQVDYWLGRVVRREVQNRKVDHLYDPRAMFGRRLELLEALASCSHDSEIAALPLARLRTIATERNSPGIEAVVVVNSPLRAADCGGSIWPRTQRLKDLLSRLPGEA